MGDIGSVYCKNHEYAYRHPMQRLYRRIKGVFRAIGWYCADCTSTILDNKSDNKIIEPLGNARLRLIKILGGKCSFKGCSIKDVRVLELHHPNGDGLEDRLKHGHQIYRYYLENIEEAKKMLSVTCANHHRILDDDVRESKKDKQKRSKKR